MLFVHSQFTQKKKKKKKLGHLPTFIKGYFWPFFSPPRRILYVRYKYCCSRLELVCYFREKNFLKETILFYLVLNGHRQIVEQHNFLYRIITFVCAIYLFCFFASHIFENLYIFLTIFLIILCLNFLSFI